MSLCGDACKFQTFPPAGLQYPGYGAFARLPILAGFSAIT